MTTSVQQRFRIFRGPSAVVGAVGPHVLAVAGFDGVHAGHVELLRQARDEAARRGLPVGAATFDDSTRTRRDGDQHLPALNSLSDRLRLLRDAGMDFVVLFPGDPATVGIPREMFTQRILLGVMKAQLVVLRVGGGAVRAGNTEPEPDVEALAISRVRPDSWVSTTRIRHCLSVGDVETVSQLLGRRHEVTATVRSSVDGQVQATVPHSRVIPGPGNYRVTVEFSSRAHRSLIESIATVAPGDGHRPGRISVGLVAPIDHGRLRIGFVSRCPANEHGDFGASPLRSTGAPGAARQHAP